MENISLRKINYNIDDKYCHKYSTIINEKKLFDISAIIKGAFIGQSLNISNKQEQILLLIAKLSDDLLHDNIPRVAFAESLIILYY
jgi:hypothetical protein